MNRKPQTKPVINRYKMFKYGKHWVYAGITLASVGTTLLVTTNAQAADTPSSNTPNAAVAAQPTTASTLIDSDGTGAAAPATTPTTSESNHNLNNNDTDLDQENGDQSDQGNTSEAPANDSASSATDDHKTSAQDASDASSDDRASEEPNSATEHSDAPATDPSATNTDSQAPTATPDTLTDSNQPGADTPTLAKKAAVSPVSSNAPVAQSSHGPVYTTDDKTLDHKGTITIEKTGPYAVTWKEVSTTNQTETKTVTLDASDFVALIKTINETTGNTDKLAAAKAKYEEMLAKLKALPSKVASEVVGNLLYQMIFTGTGSQALSTFRTKLDPTRYNISNTWTGLDPVAYAADRAAAETYYPAAVTWYNNVAKETWSLPEYNNPTQYVRATYIQNGDSTKTVVIGQGWTERPDWIGYVSKIWYDMGYNILMPSQRGQFLSDGNDMTFGYQDKHDWINWVRLVDERNGKNSEVVFYGQSLGADTVIEAASVPNLSKSVKAVIADAGYATLPELGSSLYNKAVAAISAKLTSVGLPAITSIPFLAYDQVLAVINNRLMKQQGFSLNDLSGVSAASKVTVPLMLIHTEDDAFIPYTQSLELAAANNSKIKTVWILPGEVGGHAGANNAILQYTQHIKDFLGEAMATNVDTGAAVAPEDTLITDEPDAPVSIDPEDDPVDVPTDNTNSGQHETPLDQAKPTDVDQGSKVTIDQEKSDHTNRPAGVATSTPSIGDHHNKTDKHANVDLSVLSATTASPVSAATLVAATSTTAKPLLDAQDLIADDQSGSVVTASLKQDQSTPVSANNWTTAQLPKGVAVNPTATKLVDHSTATPQPKAQVATDKLPQTADKPQSWIAALGASLAALATGLWASLRRRFNR